MKQQKLRYRTSRNAVAKVIARNRKAGKKVKFCPSDNPIAGNHYYIASHPNKNGIFVVMAK